MTSAASTYRYELASSITVTLATLTARSPARAASLIPADRPFAIQQSIAAYQGLRAHVRVAPLQCHKLIARFGRDGSL